MAVLGKIRSKGILLICIIGLGLFAFIAGDLWKSLEQLFNSNRNKAGVVLGEKVDIQEYQDIVNEWTEVAKLVYNTDNVSGEMSNQINDGAWQDYCTTKIMDKECGELGLTVTEDELKNLLESQDDNDNMRVSQYLQGVLGGNLFLDPQTGRFSYQMVKQIIDMAEKAKTPQEKELYARYKNAWLFVEKHLANRLRDTKYQALFQACFLSNPVEAKANYTAKANTYTVDAVYFPLADVAEPKVTDDEIKAKYEEMKPMFRTYQETRIAKYVNYVVQASDKDIAALQTKFEGYKAKLDTVQTKDYMLEFGTDISYLGLPVTKNALQGNPIAQSMLDSLAVGQTSDIFESFNATSRTKNIIKLIAKENLPDSVQYRGILVKAESTDSVLNAVKAGADFSAIAKNYAQPADSAWMTAANYEKQASVPTYYKDFINGLYTTAVGEPLVVKNYGNQGDLIALVIDKRYDANAENDAKYTFAMISEDINFSDATYNDEYNRFAGYVSKCNSIDALIKNAPAYKYEVRDINWVTSMHGIPGGYNPQTGQQSYIPSTIDAQRWVFNDDTKEGQVSTMFPCGENNEFVVVALEKIVPVGYASLDVKEVKEQVKAAVIKDKRAKTITDKLKGVNTVEGAVAKGGKQVSVDHIQAANSMITIGEFSEAGISGAIAATANGAFCAKPFVGQNAVYVFKVTNKVADSTVAYNEKSEMKQAAAKMTRNVGSYLNQLANNAEIVDLRYKFFQ